MKTFGASLAAATVFLLLCVGAAFTNDTAVPATRLGTAVRSTGANDVKPAECAALALTALASASGNYTAPNGVNGLLLGSSGIDRITGRSGNECIVGGAGVDTINGGSGTDVCIGGPGIDTFTACETQIQ